jgi:hypothetical protein
LPSPITLKPSGPFHVFISLVQIFKLLHPLMQQSLCFHHLCNLVIMITPMLTF